MNEDLKNLLITIISGVMVYVLSQLFAEFILRPIQEYKQLKAKVSKLLILYACYYSNPWIHGQEGDSSKWSAASHEMRELSAEVAAFAEIKPWQFFVFYAIPSKKHLLTASKYLMGLSNAFFTTSSAEDRSIDRAITYPDIIRKHMRITHRTKRDAL